MIFAVLLAAAGAFFRFGPMKKNFNKAKWLFRVQIEGDRLTWVQYLPDKTIRKEKNLTASKRCTARSTVTISCSTTSPTPSCASAAC